MFKQGEDFVKNSTGRLNVDRPLKCMRESRNRPGSRVVANVSMRSTDVDIPALEFIVFVLLVRLRVLVEKPLGWGTLRGEEINRSKFGCAGSLRGTLVSEKEDFPVGD